VHVGAFWCTRSRTRDTTRLLRRTKRCAFPRGGSRRYRCPRAIARRTERANEVRRSGAAQAQAVAVDEPERAMMPEKRRGTRTAPGAALAIPILSVPSGSGYPFDRMAITPFNRDRPRRRLDARDAAGPGRAAVRGEAIDPVHRITKFSFKPLSHCVAAIANQSFLSDLLRQRGRKQSHSESSASCNLPQKWPLEAAPARRAPWPPRTTPSSSPIPIPSRAASCARSATTQPASSRTKSCWRARRARR
jgi:hypothetical protein